MEGTPWIGEAGPENAIGDFGFFVTRGYIAVEEAAACSMLEALHVMTDSVFEETGRVHAQASHPSDLSLRNGSCSFHATS